jgi:hypothetical protein
MSSDKNFHCALELQGCTKMLTQKIIDAAFMRMADDADYQKEAQTIADEFAESDCESFGPRSHTREKRIILHNDIATHKSDLKINTEN